MRIADLNLRITFQKLSVVTDKYGNHTNSYKDFFSCWATASGSGNEAAEAGIITPKETIDFTVRWCKALDAVTSDGWRIMAAANSYNILYVNPMGNHRKCLKFHCERTRK
jgi:SPP1 family predicted phage head-tail adaptor